MSVNKIVTKVDGVENKTIDFNDLKSGLSTGNHTITVEAYNGATLISSQTKNITIAAGASYDADYQAVLDYATTNAIALPDSAQQSIDNQLLIDYKATGAWAKDDCFMKFTGTASAAFKLIDWKRLISMVGYGSLTWSDTGAKGNGTNAYIDPLYIPNDAANNWKANDTGVIIGISKMPTVIGSIIFGYRSSGGQFTTFHIDPDNSNAGAYRLNENSFATIANVGIIGLNGGYVDATNTTYIAGDTENKPTGTQIVPDGEVFLLAYNRDGATAFTDAEIDYVTFGADKRAEHAAIKTVLE